MGFLGVLLSRQDQAYSLSLLVPFAVYNLALKAYDVASRPQKLGLARTLKLMRSDVFFNLGYALVWIGLFGAARRRGPLRRVVVFLFHAMTMLVATVRVSAHEYFRETGTTLDYDIVALWLPRPKDVKQMTPPSAWVLLAAALSYATLGPWFVSRALGRWRGWSARPLDGTPRKVSFFLGPLGLVLQALGFGSLSLLTGPGMPGAGKSFARDPFVNLIVTGVKVAMTKENAGAPVEHPAAGVRLVRTPRTERRNVVLVHLESIRARSVTPYNKKLKTTPFLDELARKSLLAERAYTIIPNSLKASISVNCGIEPSLWPGVEAEPTSLPAPGLAGLLKGQGYRTVFFQSATERFMYFGGQAEDLGYEEYYPVETMDTEGFERSNYFGYEDDVMLKPSEEWLKKRGETPFVAEYLTSTGHHDYFPPTRYGQEHFVEDEKLNRYLNCVRYLDFFLNNLIDQYKRLSLYEDTIFVIFGDHGEGFGEHGRYVHEDNPYEESLKVPLIIHAPWRFQHGERVEELSNLTDILPTVLDLLGYEVRGGKYPGYSLLRPLPEERTLFFSCTNRDKCLASIKGYEKYIHHYGDEPDEFFDLSVDPLEKRNLADERAEEARKRRDELLAWRSRINATYGR
ncbi:MAG: sulfatase-like hydrolase/transferase [Actinomycetota bacterium]|nr:sulfatase-like hydrolase/transferase [Actinomycetota bacterium]